MPGQSDPAQPPPQPTPTPFGLQIAQLVVIPAVIVGVCIALAWGFALLAGAKDSIDTHLMKLRQSSGAGRMAMGLQDPRYKDRGLAAYNIATMIPAISNPTEKKRISDALVEILDQHVAPDEQVLQAYLLMAIGQLGQPGGLEAIITHTQATHPFARQGAVSGVLNWPDQRDARRALPGLTSMLADDSPMVRASVAASLGRLAEPGDKQVLTQLRAAMEDSVGIKMREASWNAAVALTRLGDANAARFVAGVLLDRDTLSQLPADQPAAGSPGESPKMPPGAADRVILATLASLSDSNDPLIWDKIQRLADSDPSRVIRNAASQLVLSRAKRTGRQP